MRSLRTHISLSILLTLLVTVGLIGLFSNFVINREFTKYIIEQEKVRSKTIVMDLSRQYDSAAGGWDEEFLHLIGMYSMYNGHVLKIFDREGNMAWDAENHNCWHVMDDISAHVEKRSARGDRNLVTQTHDILRDGDKIGSVSVTSHGPYFLSEGDFLFIRAVNAALLAIGILAGVCSIIVGYVLARRIARPIIETANTAKQIERGDYGVSFGRAAATRELNDLVTTVSRLAKTLSEQENWRKEVTMNVAHNLRTPLTVIGTHLEAMSDGMWEPTPERLKNCHEEVLRFGKLVAELEGKLLGRPEIPK